MSLHAAQSHYALTILDDLRTRPEEDLQNLLKGFDQPPWEANADRRVHGDGTQRGLDEDEVAATMHEPTLPIW
jgi:hypothetical protein